MQVLIQYKISYYEVNAKIRKKVLNNSYIGKNIVIRYNIDNGKLNYNTLNLIKLSKLFLAPFLV